MTTVIYSTYIKAKYASTIHNKQATCAISTINSYWEGGKERELYA